MSDFKDSEEATFRRRIRAHIRSAKFSKAERDVVLALVNHWFHHRKSVKGVIHPGRKKLAAKAMVSIKTVSRTLEMLRHHGAIEAINHLNGLYGNATEYAVSVPHLVNLCGLPKTEIHVIGGTNGSTCGRDKMSHRINNIIPFPFQDLKSSGGAA